MIEIPLSIKVEDVESINVNLVSDSEIETQLDIAQELTIVAEVE